MSGPTPVEHDDAAAGAAPTILTAPYYARLDRVEREHWWCRSVRRVGLALVADRIRPGATVLDAGCGTGGLLRRVESGAPGVRTLGLDLTPLALPYARSQGLTRLAQASVLALPVASSSVDVLFSNDVLQHLPAGGDAVALAEVRRVLRPGGLLCVRSNLGTAVQASDALHRRYDRRSLVAAVEAAGLEVRQHLVLHAVPALLGRLRHRSGHHGHGHHGHEPEGDATETPPTGGGLAIEVPPAPVNLAMGAWARIEDTLARALPVLWPLGDVQLVLAARPPR